MTWGTEFGSFLTLGIQLAIAVVVFFFVGRWLDGVLGTAPWLMLVGLAVGIAGGLTQFIRSATAAGRKQDEESRKNQE